MSLQQTTLPRPSGFSSAIAAAAKWLKTPWALIVFILLAVAVLDAANLGNIFETSLRAFAGTLPYVLLAVTLIAWLKASGAESVIARAFEGQETRMIFLAALIGGLAPFCSCEVVPFIVGLLAVGAPLSAIMAFWLSSPLIDPPTLLITASALGWDFAIAKAVGAVAIGLFGGFAMMAFLRSGAFASPLRADAPTSSCGCGPSPLSGKPHWRFWEEADRRASFRSEWIANAIFLVKWLLLAYVLEALLIDYVPSEWIGSLVGGDGVLPVVFGALVGAPAYLNSYVAPPLVAGLMEQGMSNGAAMSFMIAGAVTCIPAMAAIWAIVRVQVFAAYVVLGVTGAIMLGLTWQMVA